MNAEPNHPAPGNAALTVQLTIGRRVRGAPEPGCSTSSRAIVAIRKGSERGRFGKGSVRENVIFFARMGQ